MVRQRLLLLLVELHPENLPLTEDPGDGSPRDLVYDFVIRPVQNLQNGSRLQWCFYAFTSQKRLKTLH